MSEMTTGTQTTPAGSSRVRAASRELLEPLLTISELSEYLNVPMATIYDWRVDGKGPRGVRVGRHLRFTVSDVQDWLAGLRETEPGR